MSTSNVTKLESAKLWPFIGAVPLSDRVEAVALRLTYAQGLLEALDAFLEGLEDLGDSTRGTLEGLAYSLRLVLEEADQETSEIERQVNRECKS